VILYSSKFPVVALLVHGGDERVAGGRAEGIGLEAVLVHDAVLLGIDPGFPEETGAQLVVLVVLALAAEDGDVVVGEEFVPGRLEVAPVLGGELETCVDADLLLPCRLRSKNWTLYFLLLWGKASMSSCGKRLKVLLMR
jgi:hypothetical protein